MFGKQKSLSFLKDLACRVCKVSGEVKSFSYLLQRLAVAVQRGNAISVLGTFASKDCLIFEFYVCILCITYHHAFLGPFTFVDSFP